MLIRKGDAPPPKKDKEKFRQENLDFQKLTHINSNRIGFRFQGTDRVGYRNPQLYQSH